jgi:archaellum component FlaD/FlaE
MSDTDGHEVEEEQGQEERKRTEGEHAGGGHEVEEVQEKTGQEEKMDEEEKQEEKEEKEQEEDRDEKVSTDGDFKHPYLMPQWQWSHHWQRRERKRFLELCAQALDRCEDHEGTLRPRVCLPPVLYCLPLPPH